MAGVVVIATLTLGGDCSKRLRLLTGFVGDLVMEASVSRGAASVVLHHLSVPIAIERAFSGQ
jgi:thiamine phosphate synthase YjbQ (UPF0047 family)